MHREDFIRLFLPSFVANYFDVVDYLASATRIDIYLDEKCQLPSELLSRPIISYGFTSATVIQDFPVRGKAVYLHVRRRKWLCKDDNHIYTRPYDLTHKGTELTEEFVAFLKATN